MLHAGARIPLTASGSGVPEAPTDGQIYGRNGLSATWVPVLSQSTADGRYLLQTGGTLSGPLTLAANAASALQPVTLQQMNAAVPVASNVLPVMDGVAAIGISALYARADHVHPTDTTRAPLASPVFTGVPAAPTPVTTDNSTALATTAFVKAAIASGASIVVGDTPPASPNPNELWWDSAGTQLYIWYNDGTSSQWVPATNQNGALQEAPTDGRQYGRQSSNWTPITPAAGDVGRNLVHNALFNVQQRGAGPWTATYAYTMDRWQLVLSGDTDSVSVQSMTDAARTQVGDEAAQFYLFNQVTGVAGAGNFSLVQQPIENIRRLANKTVTVSFYAIAGSGTPLLGVNMLQNFGTGGTPSAAVNIAGQSVTLSATWQRFHLTFVMPSIAGMTLGTNGDSTNAVRFWYSAGATYAVMSGNVGTQTANIGIWGVQLEIAAPGQTQPTSLEKLDPRIDLSNCQRFFSVGTLIYAISGQQAGQNFQVGRSLPVPMRAGPTLATFGTPTISNITGFGFGASTTDMWTTGSTTATGTAQIITGFTASADL